MWVKEYNVISYCENMLEGGLTIEDIKEFCKTKIEITPEKITAWLKAEAEKNGLNYASLEGLDGLKYTLNEADYYVYTNSYNIYTEKCFKLCHILQAMAGMGVKNEEMFRQFDIQTRGNNVATRDVLRIFKPMLKNYYLAIQMKGKAENPETYLENVYYKTRTNDVKNYLPDRSLLCRRNKPSEESVALTEFQIQQWDEEYKKRLREAYSNNFNV